MKVLSRRMFSWVLLGTALVVSLILAASRPAGAVDVGDKAPEFTLPASTGTDLSLKDFKGKNFVFLEFYGLDFAPT